MSSPLSSSVPPPSSSLEEAKAILHALTAQVDSGDVDGGKSSLSRLKLVLLDFPSSPPSLTAEHLLVAASALECGVLLSVSDRDLDAFARNVAQVKPYYAALGAAGGGAARTTTKRRRHILGLNLMHLLVENRLSEFHAELELLTSDADGKGGDDDASDPYVSFPIHLERQLMVGSYDEVLTAGSRTPDPSYDFFVDSLLLTVRDSIADCLEVSYGHMTLVDAARMMKFGGVDELREYIDECRDDWILEEADGGGGGDDDAMDVTTTTGTASAHKARVVFQPPPQGSKASDIPSMKLIGQSLSYATELERIV